MKKFCAWLLVVFAALTLSACSAFHDDSTRTYPQDEPLEMTVFLQLKTVPIDSTVDAEITAWQGEMNRLIAQMAANPDPTAVKITDYKVPTENDNALQDTYTVNLTLSNVPATTVKKTVRPFKIYIKQTTYNPIALLPTSDIFTYVVGYTAERRQSGVNTEWVETQDDGTYIYLWTTGDAIEFTNVYPNRPLYYLLVLLGAIAVGVIVYFLSPRQAKHDPLPQSILD